MRHLTFCIALGRAYEEFQQAPQELQSPAVMVEAIRDFYPNAEGLIRAGYRMAEGLGFGLNESTVEVTWS